MLKIKDFETNDEVIEICSRLVVENGNEIEDTYSIFIFCTNYSIEITAIVPKIYFCQFKTGDKVLINEYLDKYDIIINYGNEYFIENLESNKVYLTRLDEEKFNLEIIIDSLNEENKILNNIYVNTKIDFKNDFFK